MSSKTALAHGTVSSIGCHVSATESNAARACVRRDVVENQMRPTLRGGRPLLVPVPDPLALAPTEPPWSAATQRCV